MKIVITGASSYVGARLFYDLYEKFELIGTYYNNQISKKFIYLDVSNSEHVFTVINQYKPNIIVHVAANSNPTWCNENPKLAFTLNLESTKNIVNAANVNGAKVIFISSFAAMNPNDVYGKTKKEGEEYVKQSKNGFVIIRPSLIIGMSPNTSNDHTFNRIFNNIIKGTVGAYDISWKFRPTYIGQLSELIMSIIKKNTINEIIPVALKELKSRYDIAQDILNHFNMEAIPIDKHDIIFFNTDSLEIAQMLNLHAYSYREVISKIVDEIRHKELFINNEVFDR